MRSYMSYHIWTSSVHVLAVAARDSFQPLTIDEPFLIYHFAPFSQVPRWILIRPNLQSNRRKQKNTTVNYGTFIELPQNEFNVFLLYC